MSFAWFASHSAPGRGAGRWLRCASLPAPRRRRRAGRARRRGPLARARARPRRHRRRRAERRHPLAERDVDRPRRRRRARLHQDRRRRGPRVRVAAGRGRLPGAGPGRCRPRRALVAAGGRRGPERAGAGGLHQRRHPVRGPGALGRQPAERAGCAVHRRGQPRRSRSPTSARRTWPSPPPRAPAAATCAPPTTSRANGRWSRPPWTRSRGDAAGVGTGRPDVAASGDGVGIVAWGEAGHIYTRRVIATTPSTVVEQADPATFAGWSETSASRPSIASGGDSTYASVAFQESLHNGSATQSRVLVNRLHGSTFDGASAADGATTGGPEGADQPQVAVTEYGTGFVTSETDSEPRALRHDARAAREPRLRPSASTRCPTATPPTPSRPTRASSPTSSRGSRRRASPGPPRSACATPPTARTSAPSRSSRARRWGPTDADQGSRPPATWPATPPWPGSRAAARARRSSPPSSSRPPGASCPPTASATSPPRHRCCSGRPRRSCGARPPTPCASTARRWARPPPPRWSRPRRWPTAATPISSAPSTWRA